MNTVEYLKDLFVQYGAGWVLWLLFALSVTSIALAIERWLVFRTKGGDLRELAATLDAHLRRGSIEDALRALAPYRSVGAAVAAAGLRLADRGPEAAEKGMESAMAVERKTLEARLDYLGTLGNNAPFVGLFGTVIGVILAFDELGQGAAGGGSASGRVASSALMGAVSEALVATAVGIAVALPAVALYNYFQRRITNILSDAEALSNLVTAYLVDRTGPRTEEAEDDGETGSDDAKEIRRRNSWMAAVAHGAE